MSLFSDATAVLKEQESTLFLHLNWAVMFMTPQPF